MFKGFDVEKNCYGEHERNKGEGSKLYCCDYLANLN